MQPEERAAADTWARFIDEQLIDNGMNNNQLADKIGMNRSAVGNWRNGKVAAPDPERVRAVAEALGVGIYDAYLAAGLLRQDDDLEVKVVEVGVEDLSTEVLVDELRSRLTRLDQIEGRATNLRESAGDDAQEAARAVRLGVRRAVAKKRGGGGKDAAG